jgi:hypothetical protein
MEIKFDGVGESKEVWEEKVFTDEFGRRIKRRKQVLGNNPGKLVYMGEVNVNIGPMGTHLISFEVGVSEVGDLTWPELFSKYDGSAKLACQDFMKKVDERRRNAMAPTILDPSKFPPRGLPPGKIFKG